MNAFVSKLSEKLEKEYKGRKSGLIIICLLNVILIALALPFTWWFKLANAPRLVSAMKLDDATVSMLHYHYNLFDLLSFVQYSGMGILGLFAMVLLILIVATLFFNLMFVVKIIKRGKSDKGLLAVYSVSNSSFAFGLLTAAASIAFQIFANAKARYNLFSINPLIVVYLVLAIAGLLISKLLESNERKIYGEHGLLREIQKNWVLFLMLVPTFIYLLINNYLPMIGVYYAFTNFNFRDGLWASPFTGFKNFEFLLRADLFKLTRNTILYNVVFIVVGNVLQIFFAILVSQVAIKWVKKSVQTLMFMPYFVSFVILKVLVYNIFEYEYGLINNIVTSMGGGRIDFYNTPSYWPTLITVFYLWKNIGYGMVVYLATITGIDTELYEAAKVDGANIFHQIRFITLPLIKPTFIILLLYALGSIMKGQFELFYQMIGNNGVLYNITDIFDTYVYRITMTQPMSIGLGTAAGLYQSLFGFIIIMITNAIVKRKNPEYALF